jgi:hypothetical protein
MSTSETIEIKNQISEGELEEVVEDDTEKEVEIKSEEKFKLVENTDHWESEDILKMVNTIHNSGKNRIEREFNNKGQHPKFEKRYPMLYRLACEDNLDMVTLNYMINMRNQVINNERSVESASRIVGDKFFRRYVSPVVNNTPPNKK